MVDGPFVPVRTPGSPYGKHTGEGLKEDLVLRPSSKRADKAAGKRKAEGDFFNRSSLLDSRKTHRHSYMGAGGENIAPPLLYHSTAATQQLEPRDHRRSRTYSTRTRWTFIEDSDEDEEEGPTSSLSYFPRHRKNTAGRRRVARPGKDEKNRPNWLLGDPRYHDYRRPYYEGRRRHEKPFFKSRGKKELRRVSPWVTLLGGTILVGLLALVLRSGKHPLFSLTPRNEEQKPLLHHPSDIPEESSGPLPPPGRTSSGNLSNAKSRTTQTSRDLLSPGGPATGTAANVNSDDQQNHPRGRQEETRRTTLGTLDAGEDQGQEKATDASGSQASSLRSNSPNAFPRVEDIVPKALRLAKLVSGGTQTTLGVPRIVVTPPEGRAPDEVDTRAKTPRQAKTHLPTTASVAIRRRSADEQPKTEEDTRNSEEVQDSLVGPTRVTASAPPSGSPRPDRPRGIPSENREEDRREEAAARKGAMLPSSMIVESDRNKEGEVLQLPLTEQQNEHDTRKIEKEKKAQFATADRGRPFSREDEAAARARWRSVIQTALEDIVRAEAAEETKRFLASQPETADQWRGNMKEEIRLLSKAVRLEGTYEQRPLDDLELIARTGQSFVLYLQLMVVDFQLTEAVARLRENRGDPALVRAGRQQIIDLAGKVGLLAGEYIKTELKVNPSGDMEGRTITNETVQAAAAWATHAYAAVADEQRIDFSALSLM